MSGVWNLQALGRGYRVLSTVKAKAGSAYGELLAAQTAIATNDLPQGTTHLMNAETQLRSARDELNQALSTAQGVLEVVDVTGTIRSGDRLLVAGEELTRAGQHVTRGVTPLLSGTVATTSTDGTPTILVDTLTSTRQELIAASVALTHAEEALTDVRPEALPAEYQAQVALLKETVPRIRQRLDQFVQQSDLFVALLGAHEARKYLILFENNHELRPTGGFIGSIALVNVDRGVVEDIDVQTVYDPDGQLKAFIAPPEPLRTITDRWYMRDANWFIEYQTSAHKVAEFFEKSGGPTLDGVIALTPEVIKELLVITGPLEVPAYNVTVSSENFVALTQDLVTYSYDRELNKPKQFLADLTPLLLTKLFTGKAEDSLAVMSALARAAHQKQLLVYLRHEDEQAKIVAAGWSGNLPSAAPGFLAINNANIGGHKSDQFISQEAEYQSTIARDGTVDVTLTIRRTHHGPDEVLDLPYPANENPAYKDNIVYQRVLVPAGAELLDAKGFASPADVPRVSLPTSDLTLEADPEVAEWQRVQTQHTSGTGIGHEAGYTSFANWIITKPGETDVLLYRYRLPRHAPLPSFINPATTYTTYIAKQPGDTRTSIRVELTLPAGVRIRHTVPHDGTTQSTGTDLTYRGALTSDLLVGAVLAAE